MSGDPALDRFTDLMPAQPQQDWPGKREPVNRSVSHPSATMAVWDDKPLKYMYNGAEREFFTISHLALALNRSVVTIRSWEAKGMMPATPYRSPRPKGEMLPGKDPKGKRLWTREQIEGILEIAASEGVILNGKPPTKRFSDQVLDLYRQLLNKDQHT